ncbi:hypothetical protein WKH57_01405 [Niallia taxi]|uniref:hypothetical protein n=1 Tax=Niallia taxi TaxID=2499688 RepID=UPI00316EB196
MHIVKPRKVELDVSNHNLIEWIKEGSRHNNVVILKKNLAVFKIIVKIIENRINKLENIGA